MIVTGLRLLLFINRITRFLDMDTLAPEICELPLYAVVSSSDVPNVSIKDVVLGEVILPSTSMNSFASILSMMSDVSLLLNPAHIF